jgi:hypothetical protein
MQWVGPPCILSKITLQNFPRGEDGPTGSCCPRPRVTDSIEIQFPAISGTRRIPCGAPHPDAAGRRMGGRAPSDPRVCTNTYHRPPSQSDRVDRSRPTSFRPTLRPIPHSACCTRRALPTAISCLGAFRTPAAGARGWHRGCRRPKTCTGADIRRRRIKMHYSLFSSAASQQHVPFQ